MGKSWAFCFVFMDVNTDKNFVHIKSRSKWKQFSLAMSVLFIPDNYLASKKFFNDPLAGNIIKPSSDHSESKESETHQTCRRVSCPVLNNNPYLEQSY